MSARHIEDRRDHVQRTYGVAGLVALCLVSWTGCSIEYINGPPEHIVMINSEGRAIDPTGNFICEGLTLCRGRHAPVWFKDYEELGTNGRESYHDYLTRLFKNLREHADRTNGGKRKVLIFVHGGLVTQRDAIGRAEQLSGIISRETNPDYPIFINWDSSFFSGYYDHLFHIRQGMYYPAYHPYAWALAPFYFLADTGRGILQAPSIWISELGKSEPEEWIQDHVSASISLPFGSTIERDYERVAQELKQAYAQNPNGDVMAISEGADLRNFWFEGFRSDITGILTLPFKMVSAPFIEAFGESSWRMNQRRTRVLFQTETEFAEKAAGEYRHPDGALALFMERLAREYRADQALNPPREWDITLVGHSMGAIVLNEVIRRFGVTMLQDDGGKKFEVDLPFNRIVYLGAACSVRDYEDSLFPYLMKNKQARFYHVVLHEEAEEREGIELVPRGSILVWLDDFMDDPKTPLDRMLGNYVNLTLAAHDTPEAMRRRISIKAFGAGKTVQAPQTHSELTDKLMFWKEKCWKPGDADQPECFDVEGR